jgi:threonine aldolase
MNGIDRRRFVQTGVLGLGASIGDLGAGIASAQEGLRTTRGTPASTSTRVRMTGDGLYLTAGDQARLLTRLSDDGRIKLDSYSNGGTVAAIEQRFAALLGKERAVFMPTGTLANHLAVRALAGGTGRAVVQAESHLFNDSGDCVQALSAITLMPLAPGKATFTLEQLREVVDRTASGRVARPVSRPR